MNPNLQGTQFSLASDSGISWARQASYARPLPSGAGQGGGMRTTNEAAIAQNWMNPTTGSPRPGMGQGTVLQ